MKRKRTGVVVAGSAGAAAFVLAVGWLVVVPRVVASKIAAAADRRSLEVQYEGARYRFTTAWIDRATITPKGSKAIVIAAPEIEAKLSGFHPTWAILHSPEVAVAGSPESLLDVLDPILAAEAKLPPEERIAIDVQGGKLRWKEPLGDDTSLSFASLAAWIRPAESSMQIQLGGGRLELPSLSIAPLSVDLVRKTGSSGHEDVKLVATLAPDDGRAKIMLRRREGDSLDASFEDLALEGLDPKVSGLDLSKAHLAGEVHAERDEDGAVRSDGKLVLSSVRLPPVSVGPVSVAIGGTVKTSWKASPKKGAPGVATIDDARVEVVLGGKPRVVRVSGEVSVGEEGEGPYDVRLEWDAGPIPCSEIAKDLAGAVAGKLVSGLVGSAVSGNVAVHGTLRGDVSAIEKLKSTFEIREACKVDLDLPKGLGGFLPKFP